jgi:hypothetical protein
MQPVSVLEQESAAAAFLFFGIDLAGSDWDLIRPAGRYLVLEPDIKSSMVPERHMFDKCRDWEL